MPERTGGKARSTQRSDAVSFVTGAAITVDGGAYAQ
jgi:hypothetical protein